MKSPIREFDPSRHVTKVSGRDYLEVKWRLVWLRSEHPEAAIETTAHTITDDAAVFFARVRLPGGGEATGWGSETSAQFEDFVEKAETRALGRALAALGYGLQFCADFDESESGQPVRRSAGGASERQVHAIYAIGRSRGWPDTEVDRRCGDSFGGRLPAGLSQTEASSFIDSLRDGGGAKRSA